MTRVAGGWIEDADTQAVCTMLTAAGHSALFVGGCVRNALLGAPVEDIDIATDALPSRVMELARAAGLKPVPTGIDHGTVTVVAGHKGHEITTFRRDVETFGRHAVVAYSDDIREDAARRDFTMNALYAQPDGSVVDPLGEGLTDLLARHVRFVGHAETRIREDYLRILRFFRFTAWYGDPAAGFDPAGLSAIAANLDGLAALSRERVGAELKKLLSAPDPAPAVAVMQATGVLGRILPGADSRFLAPLVHLEGQARVAPDPMRRLCALGADSDIARSLRLSRAETRRLERMRDGLEQGAGPAALGHALGPKEAEDVLLLRAALAGQPIDPDDLRAASQGAAQVFPITARDLMPRYVGPELGAKLAELERAWIASGFKLTRDDLLRRL
ncbi:MAG: CCA tRNA nucleotidyltransferase [Paracoccaceae bacterium]